MAAAKGGRSATGARTRAGVPGGGLDKPLQRAGRPTVSASGRAPSTRPGRPATGASGPAGASREPRAWRARDVVVGRVAPAARAAGGLAVLGALGLAVRPFLPMGTVHGRSLGDSAGVLGLLGWLPAVALVGAAGVAVLRGRLPRVGLAVIAAAGAMSVATALQTGWLLGSARTALDLPVGGQALPGEHYSAGSGLVLQLITAALLVAALVCVLLGWTGTVTEDRGQLDRRRPAFGAGALFIGVLAAIAVSMAASRSAIGISPPPITAQGGLQRLAGLAAVLVVVGGCVLAASLRPWLAAPGVWLAIAVMLFGSAVENLLSVLRSADLDVYVGTGGRLGGPVLLVALAVGALLVRDPRDEPTAAAGAEPESA